MLKSKCKQLWCNFVLKPSVFILTSFNFCKVFCSHSVSITLTEIKLFADTLNRIWASTGRHIGKYQGELNVKSLHKGRSKGWSARFLPFRLGSFFAFCWAAHLNFYSAADRLTDELTDSVDVDTAPKESQVRATG